MSWRRSVDTRNTGVRWQSDREPHINDDRLATLGQVLPPVRVVAPDFFTARVMARIETKQVSGPLRAESGLCAGLVAVAATLLFSVVIVLASAGILAIFEPSASLMLLGLLVSSLVSLCSAVGDMVVWMSSATATEVMLASLAFMASVSLLVRAGIVRYSTHAPREA